MASPTSSRRLRSATCTTPSAASACEPARVLLARDAEQHDGGHAEIGERAHLLAQALLRVLHDAGHRHDRLGRVDALLHEQRRDEVVDRDPVLGDEAPQRGGAPQPAQAAFGERHADQATGDPSDRASDGRDEAVDRVRIGLDVDAGARAPRAVSRRDRTDRDHRRPAHRRAAPTASQKLSTVDDDVNVIASTSPARTRSSIVGIGLGAGRCGTPRGRRPRSPARRAPRAARRAPSRRARAAPSSPGSRGSGNASSSDSATNRSGHEIGAHPAPGERALRCPDRSRRPAPARARGRRARRGASPRSKKASTPLADVNTTHAYAAEVGQLELERLDRDRRQLDHLGAELLEPRAQLARLLARPGDDDAAAEQRAPLEPAEVEPGDRADDDRARRLDAAVGDRRRAWPRIVRCSGRVPHRTAATGVPAARPPAISAAAMSATRPAPMSTTSVPPARASASQSVSVAALRRIFVTGDDRDAASTSPRCVTGMPAYAGAAIALVTPGTTSNGTPAARQRLGLFAAAAEHERVAALQPHDGRARAAALDEQRVDLGPASSRRGRAPCRRRRARRRPARGRAAPATRAGRTRRRRRARSSSSPRTREQTRDRPGPRRRGTRSRHAGSARSVEHGAATLAVEQVARGRRARRRPDRCRRRACAARRARRAPRAARRARPRRIASTLRERAARAGRSRRRARRGTRARRATATVRGRGRRSRRATPERACVVGAALDRERALRDLRQHHARVRAPRLAWSREPEPLERGDRDDDRVVAFVRALAQPRLDVAAQRREREVGTRAPRAARAGAPNRCRRAPPVGSSSSARADERVARIAALGNRREHETRRASSDGRSLAECTARSARPSSTACCTSFTNTPVPPIACRSARLVAIAGRGDKHVARPVVGPSSAPTRSACHRASALARVSRSGSLGYVRRIGRGGRTAPRARRRSSRRAACRPRPSRAPSARAAAC